MPTANKSREKICRSHINQRKDKINATSESEQLILHFSSGLKLNLNHNPTLNCILQDANYSRKQLGRHLLCVSHIVSYQCNKHIVPSRALL